MKFNRFPVPVASACLVMLALGGMALASSQEGSQSDPMVSLSYLTDVVTPAVLEQVDDMMVEDQDRLEEQLETVAQAYIAQLETVANQDGTISEYAAYEVLYLTQGQTLLLSEGGEVLLRTGTGQCVSSSSPGLINMTTGSTLSGGSNLTANNLYLSTIDGRGIYASTAVTILVRGDYTIS